MKTGEKPRHAMEKGALEPQPGSDDPEASSANYRFGPFVLDIAKRKLFKSGQPVKLTAKCIGILIVLVMRAGRAVSKEELISEVWAETAISDATLTQHMFMLRKVLGGKERDAYIVSVPGLGYRFIGNVRADGSAAVLKRSLAAQYCANAADFWERRSEPAVRSALALYQEALRYDPENARAHAGIAECHYILADYMYANPREHLRKAQQFARQALLIDLQCAEANMAMAKTTLDLDWNWDAASRSISAALDLMPDNLNALWGSVWYPLLQRQFAKTEQALRDLPAKHGNRHLEACPGILELYAGRPADA